MSITIKEAKWAIIIETLGLEYQLLYLKISLNVRGIRLESFVFPSQLFWKWHN